MNAGRAQFAWILVLGSVLLAAGCAPNRTVHVTGSVHRMTTEGGFWVIRDEDGATYDPIGGLSPEFQLEGLRVKVEAEVKPDVVSTHMAGTMVQIRKIQKL
jgi:hypothetical protein